jgi:antitoxin YefM
MKSYLDSVVNDNEPLLIYRSNNKSVVIISLEEYNAIKETEYIMKSPAMMELLREGDKEVEQGGGTSIEIDDLWK